MEKLDELWKAQEKAEFPALGDKSDICGISLNLLDTLTDGCIDTFFARGMMLDHWRLATLGSCYGDLCTVVPYLKGESHEYFNRWRELTKLVLWEIEKKTEKEFG